MKKLTDYKATLRNIHAALEDLVIVHRETERLCGAPDSFYDLGQLELVTFYRRIQAERLSQCLGDITAIQREMGEYDDVISL